MSKTTIASGAAALWLVPCAVLAQQAPDPGSPAGEIALPDVTVTAPRVSLGGYLALQNTTALRVPAQTQDVPVSVQVVLAPLIQVGGAVTVQQAIETVSGVERSNLLPGSLSFRIRGFVDSSTSLRDGFHEQSNQQDIQGVERIEVLKGPPSVLYGGIVSSGGVVNVVTKAPMDGNFACTGLTGDSFGFFHGTLDYTLHRIADEPPFHAYSHSRWCSAASRRRRRRCAPPCKAASLCGTASCCTCGSSTPWPPPWPRSTRRWTATSTLSARRSACCGPSRAPVTCPPRSSSPRSAPTWAVSQPPVP